MKKYKHKITGIIAEENNYFMCYTIKHERLAESMIDRKIIENSNDWEFLKEEITIKVYEPKEEPNYLITGFCEKGTGAHRPINKNGLYGYFEPFKHLDIMIEEGHEIYSVKNKYGIEYVLGDTINYNRNKVIGSPFKIDNFFINKDGILLARSSQESSANCEDINTVYKMKSPIYTTTDGKEIYEGDRVWLSLLYKDLSKHENDLVLVGNFSQKDKEVADRYLTFTSEENRDKYIKENSKKFLFTTKDGVKIYNGDTYYLCIGNIAEKYIADENLDWTEEDNGIRFYDKEQAEEYIKYNRKPIFVSADGKEYFEGDTHCFFSVYPNDYLFTTKRSSLKDAIDFKNWLHFHTKEARQEYIDNNKPKYSIFDIKSVLSEISFDDTRISEVIIEDLYKLKK